MKIEATSITLDRPELAALLLSACADECRVNLCNVHVDPASGVAVTTDSERGCEWRMVIMPMRPGVMPSWQLAPAPGELPRESDATRDQEGAAAVAA